MFRKSTLIALTAVAAFGSAVISTEAANAKGMHNVGKPSVSRTNVAKVNIRGPIRPGPHVHPRRPHHPHVVVWRHRHPIVIGTRPVVVSAIPAVVPAGRCTCLTKEYTPEGAVVFKDTCTNEMAMNPPAVAPAPTAEVQPEK